LFLLNEKFGLLAEVNEVITLIGGDMFSSFFNMARRGAWQLEPAVEFDAQVEGFVVDGSNFEAGAGKGVWEAF